MTGMGFNNLDGWPGEGISNGRIWDMGVAWNQIHNGVDDYNWALLDSVVSQMESQGMQITYVIGACPLWLAKYPDNPYYAAWLGPGSNSMPSDMDEANKFFWNLSSRYAGRISSYEIWNEPQLADFLYPYNTEELADLATMTSRAYSTIKSCDGQAFILAASVLPRASSGGMSKASKYLQAIADKGWHVDAFNTHIYPNIGEDASSWDAMLLDAINTIASFSPPTSEIWVTETNYNLLGPVISENDAPSYINGTYASASSHGVKNVFWYGWNTAASIGGLDINIGTSAWNAIEQH